VSERGTRVFFLLLRQSRRGGADGETAIASEDGILPEFFLDAEKHVVSTIQKMSVFHRVEWSGYEEGGTHLATLSLLAGAPVLI
jgi:hypothetical protein